jgi:hypothetical protein
MTTSPERAVLEAPEDARVAASRRRVEEKLGAFRDGLHDTFGLVPKSSTWVVPAIGLALGFSLALRAFRRRRLRGADGTRLAGGAGRERLPR